MLKKLVMCALCWPTGTAFAEYIRFSQPTDTVQLFGNTILGSNATYEAVIRLEGVGGYRIWNEHRSSTEDKSLGISSDNIGAYGWPNSGSTFTAFAQISPVVWHHVAYVKDGSQERLYLDGNLIGTRVASSDIANDTGSVAALGNNGARPGGMVPSFIGTLDSIRISSVARYHGLSFSPPGGDLATDGDTQFRFTFDEEVNSPTINSEGSSNMSGTLGVGFSGATSPQLLGPERVAGHANLDGYLASVVGDLLEVEVWQNGNLLETLDGNYGPNGTFAFSPTVSGAAVLKFRFRTGLWKAVPVTLGPTPIENLTVNMTNGDCDHDNEVGIGDYALLSAIYGLSVGDPGYDTNADLNGDTTVDIADYAILSGSYGEVGD